MGLGNTLKIMLTQQVKCDNCGAVIVDGRTGTQPMFKLDAFGNSYKNDNYNNNKLYGDGVGVFNTLKYGVQKKNLCSMCKALEKNTMNMEAIMNKENEELAEQKALEKERLDLEREKLRMEKEKLRLQNESNITPNVNRAAKFCTNCGTALKQNANFCSRCGSRI